MVLKQCSIKYSLLFYFTGSLGEADYASGVLEPPTHANSPSLCLPCGDGHSSAQQVPETSHLAPAAQEKWLNGTLTMSCPVYAVWDRGLLGRGWGVLAP